MKKAKLNSCHALIVAGVVTLMLPQGAWAQQDAEPEAQPDAVLEAVPEAVGTEESAVEAEAEAAPDGAPQSRPGRMRGPGGPGAMGGPGGMGGMRGPGGPGGMGGPGMRGMGGPGMRGMGGGMDRRGPGMMRQSLSRLDLTDEQRALIRDIFQNERETMASLYEQSTGLEEELEELIATTPANEEAIRDKASEVAALQVKMALERASQAVRVREVLTLDQLAQFEENRVRQKEMEQERMERFRKRREERMQERGGAPGRRAEPRR